jgi:glyoxylase-like metal-dependent hydrolase (beta-lactamase superfamily II)
MISRTASVCAALLFVLTLPAAVAGQNLPSPILPETYPRVSEHVYLITGFPNVAIVVGDRATLVVDTGLGARNGATVARVARKLSKGPKLYLTTTHFHPEHAGGEPGFPPETVLIRNQVQEQEMQKSGAEMIKLFSGFSPQNAELLAGWTPRPADVTFDNEIAVDLGGGVTARLLWFGAGHTKGDELTFVEPDRTLVSGDLVQNKVVPGVFGDGGTAKSWLDVLDKIELLKPLHIVPDHSEVGDGSLVAKERSFLNDVRSRTLALKRQGVTAQDAGQQLSSEFKTRYPDWPNLNLTNLVQRIYQSES